ncbi:MAG TPA: GNAT family protein [Polyangium sp.]|nr:GNAT family protein [Polyangium sp.]
MHSRDILTTRLLLVASKVEHLLAELANPTRLEESLGVKVPAGWPPGLYDQDAIRFFLTKTQEGGPDIIGWLGWYAIRRATETEEPVLVGNGGYVGPPAADGVVEIGYSMVPDERRKGYATEIVNALVQRAFEDPRVRHVVAEVHEENHASLQVMARTGFGRIGPGRDEGHWRFQYRRQRDV